MLMNMNYLHNSVGTVKHFLPREEGATLFKNEHQSQSAPQLLCQSDMPAMSGTTGGLRGGLVRVPRAAAPLCLFQTRLCQFHGQCA